VDAVRTVEPARLSMRAVTVSLLRLKRLELVLGRGRFEV